MFALEFTVTLIWGMISQNDYPNLDFLFIHTEKSAKNFLPSFLVQGFQIQRLYEGTHVMTTVS